MQKNVASQKWTVFAFDITDNSAKTGDAANITANIKIDGGGSTGTNDTNPTELEDGYYEFDLTQAETNGEHIRIFPASTTGNIQVIGVPGVIYTTPANFPDFSVEATTGRTDVASIAGTAQTANDVGADTNTIVTEVGKVPKSDGTDSWNATALAAIQSESNDALVAYDPPTKSEMDTGHGLLATEAKQDIIDTNVDQIETTVITNATGVDIAADIIALKAETSLIVSDTNELQTDDVPGLVANVQSDTTLIVSSVAGISGSAMRGTDNALLAANVPTNFSSLGIESDGDITKTNLVDTNTDMRGTDSAALASNYTSARAGYLDNINGHTAQTGDNFTLIGNSGVGLTHLATASSLTTVDTVVDSILSILDDPRSEPGQGAPAVNADAMTKLDYLYKFMRNKIETGTTTIKIWDDAGSTVDHLSTISAAGNTFTRGEFITGA